VVTGAANGIGLAIARRLGTCGATVLAIDTDAEGLRRSFAEGGPFVPIVGDLSSDDTARLAEKLVADHGPVELIVNNVGVGSSGDPFLELQQAAFDRLLRTNLRGPLFFTQRLAQALVDAERGGAIVFISSLHSTFVSFRPHYSATKAAVGMLVREMALALAPHRIRVNAVSPGAIVGTGGVPRRTLASDTVPVGRSGVPDDVARMTVVLLSDEWAGYVTGADLPVDGGLSLFTWAHPPGPSLPR
jgi:NAD(P)-dependent dehydrogenase (short-subunit alcohol dehydrogenase family)